ncbi:fimbrial protein [Serratia proteamaculans]|uniref:fimbrial protein n=1 Tax=Serratia proteamaculans TaxID=28151 RepID=UPI003CF0D16E
MNITIHTPLRTGLLLAVLASGITAPSEAKAAYCTVVGGTRTTNFSNIIVQRDTPIGTQLAKFTIPESQVWDCSAALGVVNSQNIGVKSSGTYNSRIGNARVYNTGITGVGYALGSTSGQGYLIGPDSDTSWPSWNPGIFNGGNVKQGFWVVLYKTGTGAVSSGTVANQRIGAGVTSIAGIDDTEAPININSFKVTALACSLSSTSIKVPLGDVLISKFTGVGVSTADKSFDLGLTCDKDAKINVSLAGTQNADTSETSVLALTSAGQTGTATGVGVQLLYGGTPLKINNNLALKTSTAGGKETLPFTARYYQTKATVGIGQANSNATLSITYQ